MYETEFAKRVQNILPDGLLALGCHGYSRWLVEVFEKDTGRTVWTGRILSLKGTFECQATWHHPVVGPINEGGYPPDLDSAIAWHVSRLHTRLQNSDYHPDSNPPG